MKKDADSHAQIQRHPMLAMFKKLKLEAADFHPEDIPAAIALIFTFGRVSSSASAASRHHVGHVQTIGASPRRSALVCILLAIRDKLTDAMKQETPLAVVRTSKGPTKETTEAS